MATPLPRWGPPPPNKRRIRAGHIVTGLVAIALFPLAALIAGFTGDQAVALSVLLVTALGHLVELHLLKFVATLAGAVFIGVWAVMRRHR